MRVVLLTLVLLVAFIAADDTAVLTADERTAFREQRKVDIANIIEQQEQNKPELIPQKPVFKIFGKPEDEKSTEQPVEVKPDQDAITQRIAKFQAKNGFSYVKADSKTGTTSIQSVVSYLKPNAAINDLVADIKPQLEKTTGFTFDSVAPISYRKRTEDANGDAEYSIKLNIGDNKIARAIVHKGKIEGFGRLKSVQLLPEDGAKTLDTIDLTSIVANTPKKNRNRKSKSNAHINVKRAVNKTIKSSKKRVNTLVKAIQKNPSLKNEAKLKSIIEQVKMNYHKRAAAVRSEFITDGADHNTLSNHYNTLTINMANIVKNAEKHHKLAGLYRKTNDAIKHSKKVVKGSVSKLEKAFKVHAKKLPSNIRDEVKTLQVQIKQEQLNGEAIENIKRARAALKRAAKIGDKKVYNTVHKIFKKRLVAVKKEADHATLAVQKSISNLVSAAKETKEKERKHAKSPRKDKKTEKKTKKCYKLKTPKKSSSKKCYKLKSKA